MRLHWKDRFGDMSRTRLLPRLENLPGLTNLRKTTCQGGFFVYRAKRLRFSLNDLKKIRLKKRVLWLDEVRLTQSHIRFI